jgi:hypothetical protein
MFKNGDTMMGGTKTQVKYGINIKKYCSEHEAYIQEQLSNRTNPDVLLEEHKLKIRWLQHERLVHLIVTFIIAVLFLFAIYLFIALNNPAVIILIAIVLALLGAYIRHYFFLENTVQYWYKLYDSIRKQRL